MLEEKIAEKGFDLLANIAKEKFLSEKEVNRAAIIKRKEEVFYPLLKELEKYSYESPNMLDQMETPILNKIVAESYLYGLSDDLLNKCNGLSFEIEVFNKINCVEIANRIIRNIFYKGFEKIYGNTEFEIVCIAEDGDVYPEFINEPPIDEMHMMFFDEITIDLLKHEGSETYPIEVEFEGIYYTEKYVYSQLVDIYKFALSPELENYKLPPAVINLDMKPEEYIASEFDFFEQYNADSKIIEKKKLASKIKYECQEIVQILKETIANIVKNMKVKLVTMRCAAKIRHTANYIVGCVRT